ncbi:error-prone DNA polymerase [Pseudohoeflea coraliihabitans]|uniref:Error-prone DNA polymerase n=1 Tax=Pseudohoeflea coraliihabitans TaxID=2860393 RepID=A0ABS6WT71_9HYPH|nr:error-prone DNA polymerase [Pseudohoeflea sp. DP4N28-3]MBW3099159.1 error-prone DNA polymerase [Pseudohoeflea sp. DP4N28-3]
MDTPAHFESAYAEFAIRSHFSFLEGASAPEELTVAAMRLGLSHFGLADRNTVAGVVRAHLATREAGVDHLHFHPGARLVFADATPDILAYPKNRAGWGRLCRLLTAGNRRADKGECHLTLEDLLEWGADLNLLVLPAARVSQAALMPVLNRLGAAFGRAVRLALVPTYDGADRARLAELVHLAHQCDVRPMASNDVLYHHPGRRADQDILTAIRHHVPVTRAGRLLAAHAERHLKGAGEMVRLLRSCPEAIAETMSFAGELTFSLDELRYNYPDETFGDGAPHEMLARLASQGARQRYPQGVPAAVHRQIAHELALIAELDYAPYFLTVWDIVRFARSRGILCQGRGSAANSTICYCIGITEVDPAFADLLFERFISPERREPPDIDVDFEHERREEVIQYIYQRYGREHAGLAATVITYRARSAAREVGKAFGLSEDAISALAGSVWGWSSEAMGTREANIAGLDTADRTTRQVLDHAHRLIGFPRHLSQHVGGFVITRDRLDEVVPVMNTAMEGRTMVEWDKDDLDALGILKIDILALGMLSCLARGLKLLETEYGRRLSLAALPKEDPDVYAMMQRADTIGVFQIESRAQMSMLPRLKPKEFYDLVIEVAIVRPGPIQGDMVHPYLRRREGKEPVTFPKEELRQVLGKTLGVPLFQEQAMKIAIVAAGFSPSEADRLRRAMATFRRVGTIHTFQTKMIEGMVGNGYDRAFAERCFQQIEGFGEYGFPESHAASFALLVYASSWLKARYPDVFCAAILNAQPMGFYAPAQLVRDAREHGVEIRPVDINHSDWDCTLEKAAFNPGSIARRHRPMAGVICTERAVRLGFRQVKGLTEEAMSRLIERRGSGYDSLRDLWLRTGLGRSVIERLADADAFSSLGLSRREALWAARALDPATAAERLPLFEQKGLAAEPQPATGDEPEMQLPPMPPGEEVINDYRYLSFSLKAHPVAFVRPHLAERAIVENRKLDTMRSGRRIRVAGLVLVRQRPGSAKGVIFMTLEDETGVANIIIWPKIFERFRREILGARLVQVDGRLQNEAGVIHVVADRVTDISSQLAWLGAEAGEEPGSQASSSLQSLARADEIRRPVVEQRVPRATITVMPKGRNFH